MFQLSIIIIFIFKNIFKNHIDDIIIDDQFIFQRKNQSQFIENTNITTYV